MKRKIGVYICHCGSNIAGYLDVKKTTAYAATLPYVVVARDYQFMCSDPGQDMIKNDIKELGLNGVLVCSCSPTLHLRTFREACAEAGLNPHLCEMATIRELCSWVHSHERENATEKAMALIAAITEAPPAISVFIAPIFSEGFREIPPESKVMPLPIKAISISLELLPRYLRT